jgi:hypothetical protein
MATKKLTPKMEKEVTRNEIVSLFMLIRECKNSNLKRDALVQYVMLRVKMKGLYDEYEKARLEISEQTKPEGWQEGDSQDEWNEAFKPVMEAWLNEPAGIDTKIFTEEDCADFIMSNPNQPGTFVDLVMEYFKK